MLSKWQIIDFFRSQRLTHPKLNGLCYLRSFDELSLRWSQGVFLSTFTQKPIIKLAQEITKDWLDEEYKSLSFFNTNDSYIVLNADQISPTVLEYLGSEIEISERFLLLTSTQENTALKKFSSLPEVQAHLIESPRFWEYQKLLDFILSELKLVLSFKAKQKILQTQNPDFTSLVELLTQLKLRFPELKEISLENCEEVLRTDYLNYFDLARILAQKKIDVFYDNLNRVNFTWEQWRGLFSFLQSHMFKVADPSYLNQKKSLTQYDRDIQATSRFWKPTELKELFYFLETMERKAKSKDESFYSILRVTWDRWGINF